jgi:hypothetical protein
MAGWLGDDEKARVLAAAVEDLMRCFYWDGQARRGHEPMFLTIELDDEFSGKHVKELHSALMEMALLRAAGRHALFDDAEGFGTVEVPAVTGLLSECTGPGVVFGIAAADDSHAAASCHRNNERETIGYTRGAQCVAAAFLSPRKCSALQMKTISLSLLW